MLRMHTYAYIHTHVVDDSLTESAFSLRIYKRISRTIGCYISFVQCATAISVKCVTAKASFDFSLSLSLSCDHKPLIYAASSRVRAQPACYRSPNHAWDRPVAKIGLAATVITCVRRTFYLARYPSLIQIGKHRGECQRNCRETSDRLSLSRCVLC